jgi:hypothetical protein
MVASWANSECPICDPNDYSPVCSSGKAFKSVCDLVRQNCLGTVGELSIFVSLSDMFVANNWSHNFQC